MTRMAVITVPLAQKAAAEAAAKQFDPATSGSTFGVPLYDATGTQTQWGCQWAIPDADWTRLASVFASVTGAIITEAALPAGLSTSAADANQAVLRARAQAALATNIAYLAVGAPTNAQVVAQVRALTQQTQALIRLALQQFDATN